MSHSKRFDQVHVGDLVVIEGESHTVTDVGFDRNNQVRVECGLRWFSRDRHRHIQYIPKVENE